MPRLFDAVKRTDRSPAWPAEGTFAFLNRVDGAVWQRQRDLLERWYGGFPDPTGDLRARFRGRDPRQHYAAWWELYVHALLRALGFHVTVHPDVSGTRGHPDFLVEAGASSFYVEAATVFSGIVSPSRESRALTDIEDAIARMDASTYWVTFRVDRVGTSMPRVRSVRGEISRWLATLDPEEVTSWDLTDPASWKTFELEHGWRIALRPAAWSPKLRGCPDNCFIGMTTGIAGFVDDVPKLRSAVTRKGKHYGTPDKPLLVAALAANGFVDDGAAVDALFGSQAVRVDMRSGASQLVRNPDGVWIASRGAASRRISAVLLGVGIFPHTVARAWPTVWHHFAPTYELNADLPFAAMRVVDDTLQASEAKAGPAAVFGLSDEWPGPDPTFERCEHRPGDHAPAQLART